MAAAQPANAALPAYLLLHDEDGRQLSINDAIGGVPAVVVFVDYTCRTLCGPIIEFAEAGLAKSGLRPRADYRMLAIGLNPRDGVDEARTMRAKHLDAASPVNRATSFLTADNKSIRAAAVALGLTYAYDQKYDQYAHPAAIYVIDAAGRVRRVLSPFGLDGGDLRLALVEAGNGAVGNFADRIHLLCYRYDAAKGIYTERITAALGYVAGAALLLLLSGLSILLMREQRKAAP
jgi:protein SCO1